MVEQNDIHITQPWISRNHMTQCLKHSDRDTPWKEYVRSDKMQTRLSWSELWCLCSNSFLRQLL